MCSLRGLLGNLKVSSTDSIPTCFYSQKLGGLTSLALEPRAGGPGVGLGPLVPIKSLLNFYLLHVDLGPAHSACPHFHPYYEHECGFFNSEAVRLPFNLIPDSSER